MRIVLESEMSKQDLWIVHEWLVFKGWVKDPDSPLGYTKKLKSPNHIASCPNAMAALIIELNSEVTEATRCKTS